MTHRQFSLSILLLLLAIPCEAQFNWGSCGNNGGTGTFNQPVAHNAILTVGEIITGLRDVKISLRSSTDIDVQLYDKNSGYAIVKWPDGRLAGGGAQTTSYGGVTIAWSGYNGDGTGLGNEYINITGTTDRPYIMKVYGYQSGSAAVNYSWTGGGTSSGNCEGGSGSFQQQINNQATVEIGEIPSGLKDVYISLASTNDVDVQLFDKSTGTAIVAWPHGILSDSGSQTTTYRGMTIVWSGYNGDQVNNRLGYEFIAVHGDLTRTLVMKAFGYQSGYARVDYTWGKRFIIYSAIQGGGSSEIRDGQNRQVWTAKGCTEIRAVVREFNNGSNRNPDGEPDLELIALGELGGMFSVGFRVACGSQYQGNSRSVIYGSGNSTLVKLDIEKYYNDNNRRARVYLAGFSVGGGDVQNLEFRLKDLGIPVQLAAHIDSIELGDERVPSNVKRAMGFYQTESMIARGENSLYALDSGSTFVTNTRISQPIGPSNTDHLTNYQHRNMDNDYRTWKPFLEYLNLHR